MILMMLMQTAKLFSRIRHCTS
eukprot:UN07069